MPPTASSTPTTRSRERSPTSPISTPCGAEQGQNSVGEVDPDRHRSRLQRLGDFGSHQPELAAARRDVVIRSEFRYSGTPLISLSDTNIRVIDNVSAPPGAGAVLTDDPRPIVVELHRNGNA